MAVNPGQLGEVTKVKKKREDIEIVLKIYFYTYR